MRKLFREKFLEGIEQFAFSIEEHILHQQRHVAVAAIIGVEETLLMTPVVVLVRVIAVEYDVPESLSALGQ